MNVFPLEYKNVLDDYSFVSLHEEMKSGWSLNNSSEIGGSLSFGKWEEHSLLLFHAATVVKYRIMKDLRTPIQLCKIHLNGQVCGQISEIHTDFLIEKVWTFVLFMHPNWNIQWGGEFMCFNPDTQKYIYTPCIPNSGVLIPSNWDHVGHSPNTPFAPMRMSVAFSYAADESIPVVKEKHPELRIFF